MVNAESDLVFQVLSREIYRLQNRIPSHRPEAQTTKPPPIWTAPNDKRATLLNSMKNIDASSATPVVLNSVRSLLL